MLSIMQENCDQEPLRNSQKKIEFSRQTWHNLGVRLSNIDGQRYMENLSNAGCGMSIADCIKFSRKYQRQTAKLLELEQSARKMAFYDLLMAAHDGVIENPFSPRRRRVKCTSKDSWLDLQPAPRNGDVDQWIARYCPEWR